MHARLALVSHFAKCELLEATREAIAHGDSIVERCFALTAWTHPRRIALAKAVSRGVSHPGMLAPVCGISPPALQRQWHAGKPSSLHPGDW